MASTPARRARHERYDSGGSCDAGAIAAGVGSALAADTTSTDVATTAAVTTQTTRRPRRRSDTDGPETRTIPVSDRDHDVHAPELTLDAGLGVGAIARHRRLIALIVWLIAAATR